MNQNTITTIDYLAAERRAHLDYYQRSIQQAKQQNSRRHVRQALQHQRKAEQLSLNIISLLDAQ